MKIYLICKKNRFKFFLKFLTSFILLIFIIQISFYYYNLLSKKQKNKTNEIYLEKQDRKYFSKSPDIRNNSTNLKPFDFNKYCDSKGEWVHLNSEYFFKNGAAFYIIDELKAHIYFLTRSNIINSLELKLIIKIDSNNQFEYIVNGQSGNPWFVNGYASCTLDSYFNLKEILYSEKKIDLIQNLDKIKVYFYIRDTKKNTITKTPMELKLKYLNREKKKSAILCAKCLYLNADEYLHLNWWIELNKRAGYEKIVMCNQSLERNHQKKFPLDFGDVIGRYSDFIVLEQLECIPDFT